MEHIWTMLMYKILQNHLLCAFVANLKIGAIYALHPESFCDKNLAIRKVFAFCDSGRLIYTLTQLVQTPWTHSAAHNVQVNFWGIFGHFQPFVGLKWSQMAPKLPQMFDYHPVSHSVVSWMTLDQAILILCIPWALKR